MIPIPLEEPTKKELQDKLMEMPELESSIPFEKYKEKEEETDMKTKLEKIQEDLCKEIPYKWRIQSVSYGKASCVAYIDARDCMELLDKVVGVGNWKKSYYSANGLLFCRVEIFNGKEWVYQDDTGSESNVDKDKGHASDAFKRACVGFGIGRFLYRLPIQKLQTQKHTNGREYIYCPEKKKLLFDGDEITMYINWKLKNK